MLAKLNVKCRDAARRHILTLLQDEARHPPQHQFPLRHPRPPLLHARRRPNQRALSHPQAQLPPRVVHGIFSVIAAEDLATCFGTARTSALCSFVTMVSTLPLVILKKLNMHYLPLTMQLRRRYMSPRATLIGMKVLLCS